MNTIATGTELFDLQLRYEKEAETPKFAGYISAEIWSSMGGNQQKYEFLYDGVRLCM